MREEEGRMRGRERERERGVRADDGEGEDRGKRRDAMCPVVRGWGDQYCRNTP